MSPTNTPGFFHAVWQAKSTDHEVQAEGKRRLAELGSRYVEPSPDAKATLGDSDGAGGYLIPNNMVAEVVRIGAAANPMRRLLTVVRGVRGSAIDIPLASETSTRASVIAWGATKTNVNMSLAPRRRPSGLVDRDAVR